MRKKLEADQVICGVCGSHMTLRIVAPCFECGAEPDEIEEFRNQEHYYLKVKLFENEIFCDFCVADMSSTDPLFWGFPANFNWDLGKVQKVNISILQIKDDIVCSNLRKCRNTLKQQNFAIKNALKNGVVLPKKYWPYLLSVHKFEDNK